MASTRAALLEGGLLEGGLLASIAEDVLNRLLRSVPPKGRAALARQAREELGTLLSTAPPIGHPLPDLAARARIAAAFGATYAED